MPKLGVARHSIKSNFLFNTLHVVTGLLFPLITFPYASRIILAEGIGDVHFFTSIINYVVLLTSIGIPMYGIREIARVRDDIKELTKSTVEIISLNLILNVVGYIAVAIICCTVAKIQVNIPLFLLLSSSIILTTIGCPWFYSGVEDFKYITIRGIIIKLICIVFLFIFVRTPNDVLWYAAYTVLGSIGNYILNFVRLRKYLDFKAVAFRELDPWRHFKPAMDIFAFNLVSSIYLNLDTIMLGFLKDSISVGYYTAATKLSHIILNVVVSLGTVMLPRTSNLIKNCEMEQFSHLTKKAYGFNLFMSFPICFGLIVLAPSLIHLFCGLEFEPAIRTLQIISPIVIVIGISNLLGLQVLYPLGLIKIVTLSTCVGAAINFTLNLVLIPRLAQDGAAIATVAAETSVVLTLVLIGKSHISFSIVDKRFFRYLVASIIMGVVCLFIYQIDMNELIRLITVPCIGALTYCSILMLLKDNLIKDILSTVLTKVGISKNSISFGE